MNMHKVGIAHRELERIEIKFYLRAADVCVVDQETVFVISSVCKCVYTVVMLIF